MYDPLLLPRTSSMKSQILTFSPPRSVLTQEGIPNASVALTKAPKTVSALLLLEHWIYMQTGHKIITCVLQLLASFLFLKTGNSVKIIHFPDMTPNFYVFYQKFPNMASGWVGHYHYQLFENMLFLRK